MNILHLTDLHINDPKSDNEALRDAYYQEYFSELIENIKHSEISKMFITGDIVNHAKLVNYSHAKKVIEYLSKALNINSKDIFFTNGNHDVPREDGNLDKFESFLGDFNKDKSIIKYSERYKIYSIDNNDVVLCIDSIGSNFSSGLPSEIKTSIVDEIITSIRENSTNNIFILAHHPAESYTIQAQAPFDEGENWSRNHIWAHGGNLFRRIANKATIKGDAFWFSGDVHRQEHTNIDHNRILVVTGSCNAYENYTSAILPQVRIISTIEKQTSKIYEYQFIGHNRKGLEGNWVKKEVKAVNIGSYQNIEKQKQTPNDTPISKKESSSINTLKKCDEYLENEIHLEIVDKKIYKFGRFDTCRDITSLAWISITPLLDCRSIYKKIINQFKSKIEDISGITNNKSDCLLIGIDHWGAILSARLGAATNIRSCSVAIRGKSGSYDEHEIINNKLTNIVKGKKFIFVISDVISTGNSMSSVINKLKGEDDNWYGFAVICDPQQDRGERLIKYKDIFYICGSLRMPIINANLLPDEQILNNDISFYQ